MGKKIYLCLTFVFLFATIFAQNSGKGFSYQAVARDAQGDILASQNIEMQFTLMPGQFATTPSWQETHMATTDAFGTFSIVIGKGIKSGGTAGTYADVDFSKAEYWLKVEIMDDGVFQEIAYSALTSVPYAEFAGNAMAAPTGSITAFAGDVTNVPSGWLLCDGREISRSEYIDLYNVLGTAWGIGDNATSFNLPDLRGIFLRGVDIDRGQDPDKEDRQAIKTGGNTGNNVGSYQTDTFAEHTHTVTTGNSSKNTYTYTGGSNPRSCGQGGCNCDQGYPLPPVGNVEYCNQSSITLSFSHLNHNHPVTISTDGGNETRPVNAYVHYIIKY